MRLRYPKLFATVLILLTLGTGTLLSRQPFSAQIQLAFQTLGLWPYGIYGNGSVPTWNSAVSQFQPGGGSGGSSSATQFIATAGTTCAAPALTSTAAATNGIAISATAVLTCVGGVAVQTATAASWTSTVPILLPDGTAGAPSLAFTNDTDSGLYRDTNGNIAVTVNSNWGVSLGPTGGVQVTNAATFSWGSGPGTGQDLLLFREGPGHKFQRNSTNAQRDCIANTYASGVSWEAFCADWQTTANVALVGTRTAAAGTGRALFLEAQGTNASSAHSAINLNGSDTAPYVTIGRMTTGLVGSSSNPTGNLFQIGVFTNTVTSGQVNFVAITPTYNQTSGTAANCDLCGDRTETAVGSGQQLMIGWKIGGTLRYYVTAGGATGRGTQEMFSQAVAPTCTSANNCGTGNGTFATGSSDTAGSVTLGTNPTSGFVITFNGTWVAAPVCDVWMNKAGMVVGKLPLTKVTTTTTITVVTNGTNPATGDIYAYRCTGLQ